MAKKKMKNWVKLAIAGVLVLALVVTLAIVGWNIHLENEYPIAYVDEIQTYSKKYDFDPIWLASVIRQESKFVPDAKSSAGAIGLMQLMPETAEWICEMRGMEYKKDQLTNPDYNMNLGTWYLNYLLDMFDGNQDAALAAYNAGQGQVKTWLKDSKYSSDGKSLQTIPFEETRTYVDNINNFYVKYQKYHGEELNS